MKPVRIPAKHVVLLILTFAVIAFIFTQSVLPQNLSAEESGWFRTHIMEPVFGLFGLQAPSHHVTRKLAHIFEFFVLSALLVPCWKGNAYRAAFSGFAVAFLDESLQLLTARGAALTDVWIDLIGVTLGTLLGLLLWAVRYAENRTS